MKTGKQWAEEFGLKPATFYARLKAGWSMRRIQEIPVTPNGRLTGPRAAFRHWRDCVPRRIKASVKCHPVVRAIYNAMNRERCTYGMMSKRSGVGSSAIMAMRRHGPGYFANVEAMANVVGLTIRATRGYGQADD